MNEEWKPETVYHLAAQAGVSQWLEDPVEDLQINTERSNPEHPLEEGLKETFEFAIEKRN